MRWLILTDDHPPMLGGIATFVRRVARGLASRGAEVVVVGRGRPERAAIAGTRWVPARGPSFGRWAGRWLALAAGSELWRADHVLATTWVAGTTASRLRPDVVVVAHGSDVTRPPVRSEAVFRRVWRSAGRRFALSRHLASTLQARRVFAELLPAPVPVDVEPPPARLSRGRWGYVGRLVPGKGVDRFVRWVAAAGVHGVIVGAGPSEISLRRLVHELGAHVTFVGPQAAHELATTWPELDLVVLAPRPNRDGSGAEGLGMALLEAAGRGVPVVGCRTGGVPEAVGPGLLVDEPDRATEVVDAIRAWWTPQRGREAWEWVREHHGIDRTLATLGAPP